MLDITDSRLLDILSPRIKRIATVYESGQEPSPAVYWKTRPPDERIAAVIATVSLMSDLRLTLDMLEFVGYLNEYNVRYLVVGGYALGFYGHPRFTKDLDIWVERTPENADKLAQALAAFEIPMKSAEMTAFVNGGPIRIGRPPNLIDIIGHPDGVTFADCYPLRETASFEALKIDFIDREHFVKNKLASGRLQDLADVEHLEASEEDNSGE